MISGPVSTKKYFFFNSTFAIQACHFYVSVKFYFCEVLNVLNIIFQLYFTDFFLGGEGKFQQVATDLYTDNEENHVLTDTVFPLTATCEPFRQ